MAANGKKTTFTKRDVYTVKRAMSCETPFTHTHSDGHEHAHTLESAVSNQKINPNHYSYTGYHHGLYQYLQLQIAILLSCFTQPILICITPKLHQPI